jgi:transposase InsO family protein
VGAGQDDRAAAPSGLAVAHGTLDRLLGELGRHGLRRGNQPPTTTSTIDPAARAGDLVDRDVTAPAPNRVWIGDFPSVRAGAAMVEVAFVVDL